MDKQERVIKILFESIEELNDTLPKDRRIPKNIQAILYDPQGVIDSLGLTLLIISLEQKIEQEFGVRVNLVDDQSAADESSPFRTVSSLLQHIIQKLH